MSDFGFADDTPLSLGAHLGRVEGKVDALLLMQTANERRLHAVEKQVWWGRGAIVAVLFVYFPKLHDLATAIGLG